MKSTKNKLLVIMAVVLLCISNLTPVIALAESNNDPADALPAELEAYSDSYIEFSERLAEIGIMASVCIEDFVAGYENYETRSINEYIDDLIEWEVEISNNQGCESFVIISSDMQRDYSEQQDSVTTTNAEVWRAYERIYDANKSKGNNIYLPYATFEEAFESSNYSSAQEYADAVIEISAGTYSGSEAKWYDNLGATFTNLPTAAQYDKYNLLATVSKGDIIQETQGDAQLTGHIALSLGRYYDASYDQYYIRTVEANSNGVVYGALDDTRIDDRGVNIFYVTGATNTQINAAANFALSQLGKPYNYAAIVLQQGYCSNTDGALSWYCSELVWAAYYNQGLNLNGSTVPLNIYLPSELANSALLSTRNFR